MAHLLIVDDEPPMRLLIRHCLKGQDHTIREAGNAQEALALLAEQPADVVFCDVQMPGEDGVWLTGQIRNTFPLTAVILATGVSTVAPSTSMRAGVMAYLVKPFRPVDLLAALTVALKWCVDANAAGPHPDDVGDKLSAWLDSLDES